MRAVILCFIIVSACSDINNKYMVVDIKEAFEAFAMQKEFKDEVDAFIAMHQGEIDSLTAEANQVAELLKKTGSTDRAKMQEFERLYDLSAQKQEQLDKQVNEMVVKYDGMIHKRMNANLKTFADVFNAELILSKGGAYPAVLFSSDEYDKTEEFIEYINADYQGD